MKLGSLCSGAAGLDMAVEAAFGATTAWHCEYDAAASKVLAHRYPGTPNHSDLTTTDWHAVEPIDILCAGWPCQPFSLAGRQKGAADERAIWPQIADAIRILRPRIVVLENVSAVLRHEFGRVANSLAHLGYDLRWRCVRAADVGAPHRRERLFVIAHTANTTSIRRDERRTQPARLVGRSDAAVRSDGPVGLLPTPAARDCKGHGPSGMRRNSPNMSAIADLLPTPTVADSSGGGRRNSERYDREDQPQSLREYANGTSEWGKYAPAIARWEAATRPAPAPTEPNRAGNPRLNPAFSEWMMGWPQGWVTAVPGISRNDQLRIIGNGVVPQAAHHAIQTLLNVAEVVA